MGYQEFVYTWPGAKESEVPDFNKYTLPGSVPSGWIELPDFIKNLKLSGKYKVCLNDYAKTGYPQQAGEGDTCTVRCPDLKRSYSTGACQQDLAERGLMGEEELLRLCTHPAASS